MATPEQMQILITAQTADAVKDVERLAKSLDNVSTKAVPRAGNAMGMMGRKAGQAGIQIQQLVGQVQGGVNPMVALSQQAADLGFVLGVPLVGAVAGITASLAGPFISALIGSSESIEDLTDRIRDLNDETRTMTDAQKALIALTINEEIRELNQQREKQLSIIREINREMEREQFISEDEARRLKIAQAERDTLAQQILEQKNALQELNTATKEQSMETLQLAANYGAMYTNLELLSGQQKVLAEQKREEARQAKESAKETAKQGKVVSEMAMRYADYYTAADIAASKQKMLEINANNASQQIINQTKPLDELEQAYLGVANNGVGALEDGLVGLISGTMSAKDAFRNMAASIIQDMIRMQIQQQITGVLGSAISGMIGSYSANARAVSASQSLGYGGSLFGGGRSTGGPVAAGTTYLVGENGPELFTAPSGGGSITSNSNMGGVTINQTINVSTGVQQTVRTEIANLLPQIANASKAAVLDARKRGGSFAGAF